MVKERAPLIERPKETRASILGHEYLKNQVSYQHTHPVFCSATTSTPEDWQWMESVSFPLLSSVSLLPVARKKMQSGAQRVAACRPLPERPICKLFSRLIYTGRQRAVACGLWSHRALGDAAPSAFDVFVEKTELAFFLLLAAPFSLFR